MKTHARVVVIGGGVTGCSVLYHLASAGWTDCLLIERSELTSGSTWHAAGGTAALAASATMTWLHRYSFELYPKLEAETGQSCGFHHVGGLMIARTERRMEELELFRSKARRVGFSPQWLDEAEARALAPILHLCGVKGVLYEASRGHIDPSGVTHAFAKGARDRGAEIVRHCPVLETNPRCDGAWEVVTAQGTVVAEHVVNAAGLWAREVAALAGIRLPLMPVEHHYVVTEPIPEIAAMDRELPLIGDADAEFYMRQEGQGLLLGVYESPCTHWAVEGTPQDFGHELLPDDLARMEHNMAHAVQSVPVLGRAGIKRVVNGPMIFSPDLNPLVGPLPGLRREGAELGLRCAGMRALGSLRLEKGFAGWGRELSPDYDPFQAGLGRFVKLDKDGFIGRDAALRAAEREPDERLVLFEIDADDTDPCADPWGGGAGAARWRVRRLPHVGRLRPLRGQDPGPGLRAQRSHCFQRCLRRRGARKAASRAPARPSADRSRRAPDARLSASVFGQGQWIPAFAAMTSPRPRPSFPRKRE